MSNENPVRDTLISAEENRAMFDRIARRYDVLNRIISMGHDRIWRREAVALLRPYRGGRYLDLGTGTGELVIEMLRQSANILIDGVDASEGMLRLARQKAARCGAGDAVSFYTADALDLPMESDTYDGIISGFCFRNIECRQRALDEMLRVLRPGGMAVILEAANPEGRWARMVCHLYMAVASVFGRMMGGGSAYRYLMDSIYEFPSPGAVTDMFIAAGFSGVQFRAMTLGSVCIFSGKKAARTG